MLQDGRQAIAGTQQRLIQALLRRNAETAIGRRYGFAAIRSVADYQARVPLSDYADYQAAIEWIGAGEAGTQVVTQLLRNPRSQYIPVAFVDDVAA